MNRSFKLQVMVSDTFISRLDVLCKALGCSRSSLCSMMLNKTIDAFEKSFGTSSDSIDEIDVFTVMKLE